MNKGDILIATDPCVMDELEGVENALTVGKEYVVDSVQGQSFKIYDDQNEIHGFDIPTYREFFIRKEKNYDKIVDLMKADVWKRIQLLPEEKTSVFVDMQERTINDDGRNYTFSIRNGELFDIQIFDEDGGFHEQIDYRDLCVEDLIYLLEQWEQGIQ